ncbi:unnamed protein product [Hapterophycus canaliculatus]
MYNRRVLAGEFTVVNKYLLRDLTERGLWTPEVRNQIIADQGSVQNVRQIPQELKDLYKTVWEIKQKFILNQAADRGAYICQSQSMNVHMAEASFGKLSSMHFYAWKKGLKTGMYYLRTRPKADAIQFTVDQSSLKVSREKGNAAGPAATAAAAAGGAGSGAAVVPPAAPALQVEEEPECLSCGA